MSWLYGKAYARIATCVGGMDPSKERRTLNHGAHIVVGTPGRLRDHLERGALDLSELQFVVLDEADEMLNMGFQEDIDNILKYTPEEKVLWLFSATMPKEIREIVGTYMEKPFEVKVHSETKTNENIDDVIALHKSGERILALRCYRRIYRGKPLKEAVNFLNSLDNPSNRK